MEEPVWLLVVPFLWIGCSISQSHPKGALYAQVILWIVIGALVCWRYWSIAQVKQTQKELFEANDLLKREKHAETVRSANVQVGLQRQITTLQSQVAIYEGDKSQLGGLTYAQLSKHEERLLRALTVIREVKELEVKRTLQLAEANLCAVCSQGKLEVLFRPCRHVCCCSVCAVRLQDCPICRAAIKAREKIFVHS